MKNKDFLSFIIEKEAAPAHLKSAAKKDIELSFRAKSIITRFLAFYLLGALFSMSVCPQFGLGLVQGHGITHVFRMVGDWACAAFCGSVFLSAGLLVAFIGMKGEELWWVWNRYKYSLMILPAVLWSGLMLTNLTFDKPSETAVYHLTWIVFAMMIQMTLMKIRSASFVRVLKN
jgi:hypothetical protein